MHHDYMQINYTHDQQLLTSVTYMEHRLLCIKLPSKYNLDDKEKYFLQSSTFTNNLDNLVRDILLQVLC